MCLSEWEGSLGEMVTCICMAEYLHCSPEATTILLISYTPMQNVFGIKKIKFKKTMKIKKKLSSVDKVGFSSRPLQAQDFLIIFLGIMREIKTPRCFYRFFFLNYFGKQISQNYLVKWIYYRGKYY